LTSSVGYHDRSVLALSTGEAVFGVGALETVKRTGAAIIRVKHVLVVARLADHYVVILRVDADTTVEWAS